MQSFRLTAKETHVRQLLADVFVLYVKTKSFHWHMSGSYFRDYPLLLDEQAAEIFAMTDPITERARKIGGSARPTFPCDHDHGNPEMSAVN